jgi:hypothetical protein
MNIEEHHRTTNESQTGGGAEQSPSPHQTSSSLSEKKTKGMMSGSGIFLSDVSSRHKLIV